MVFSAKSTGKQAIKNKKVSSPPAAKKKTAPKKKAAQHSAKSTGKQAITNKKVSSPPAAKKKAAPKKKAAQNEMSNRGTTSTCCGDPNTYTEVDEILAYRKRGATFEFLIRWENNGCDDSWEPMGNLNEGALEDALKLRKDCLRRLEEIGLYF